MTPVRLRPDAGTGFVHLVAVIDLLKANAFHNVSIIACRISG